MKHLFLCLLIALAISPARTNANQRPNVVFIVIDNVGFEHMGECYGGQSYTPAMDRIAANGVKFTRAYATTPLCVPSRYTCLSGRYASRCTAPAALDVNPPGPWRRSICELEADRPNLGNLMKRAGYATGFVGKYHLQHERLMERFGKGGSEKSVFDPEADRWLKASNAKLVEVIRARGFDFVFDAIDFHTAKLKGIDFGDAGHNMEAEVLGAIRFIDENKDHPFFLYLSTHLLHLPFHPEKNMLGDYARQGRVTEGGLLPEAPQVPMPTRREIYDRAKAHGATTAVQIGMHWLDTGIGAVLVRLEELNLAENTLVIVFSDNNQHGKETLYEGGARVPCLMMWPERFAAGQTCDKLVANIDFAPTILDAAGALGKQPSGTDLDGQSLVPLLAGTSDQWRDALLLENGHTRTVVTQRWKYLALRYPDDVQEQIDEVDRTGRYPKLTPKAETFFDRFKKTLTPAAWQLARNSHRWHTPGNNYMKSIDDYPFMFDVDQLFDLENLDENYNERENLAGKSEYAATLAELQEKLKAVLAPLDRPFGEFCPAGEP